MRLQTIFFFPPKSECRGWEELLIDSGKYLAFHLRLEEGVSGGRGQLSLPPCAMLCGSCDVAACPAWTETIHSSVIGHQAAITYTNGFQSLLM